MINEYQKSFGAIPFTTIKGIRHYLIIQQTDQFFGFPKGHVEKDESEEETALREIYEEAGIQGSLINGFKEKDYYSFVYQDFKIIHKEVVYFLMEFESQKINIQEDELLSYELLPYKKALSQLSFESAKQLLIKAEHYLNTI